MPVSHYLFIFWSWLIISLGIQSGSFLGCLIYKSDKAQILNFTLCLFQIILLVRLIHLFVFFVLVEDVLELVASDDPLKIDVFVLRADDHVCDPIPRRHCLLVCVLLLVESHVEIFVVDLAVLLNKVTDEVRLLLS
jgi:hypothetical protein